MLRQSVILRSKFPSLGGVVRSTGVVLKSAQAPLAPKLIHKNRPRGWSPRLKTHPQEPSLWLRTVPVVALYFYCLVSGFVG